MMTDTELIKELRNTDARTSAMAWMPLVWWTKEP